MMPDSSAKAYDDLDPEWDYSPRNDKWHVSGKYERIPPSPYPSRLTPQEETPLPKRPQTPREKLLNDAKRIVTGDRNLAYGEPEDNSRRIAELWNAFLLHRRKPPTEPLAPYEVFLLMGLMKIARIMYDPSNYDSYLDAASYITVAWDAFEVAASGGESESQP